MPLTPIRPRGHQRPTIAQSCDDTCPRIDVVNSLDIVLVLAMIASTLGGFRVGFFARLLSWIGLGLGLAAGTLYVSDLASILGDSSPMLRGVVALGFIFGLTSIGFGLGLALGTLVQRRFVWPGRAEVLDRVAGAILGLGGMVCIVWIISPAIAELPGEWSRLTRSSTIVAAVQAITPEPPDAAQTLRRVVRDQGATQVFADLQPAPSVGEPPTDLPPARVVDRVNQSTVLISGSACRRTLQGTGFVVTYAGDDELVVTNAHVVAGQRETTVQSYDSQGHAAEAFAAQVVWFDPAADLALLRIPTADIPAVELADPERGAVGAITGHPSGGPRRATPARVERSTLAEGTDIYDRQRVKREVLFVAARLEPGDSGGPLFDDAGQVIGIAFAIAPDDDATAYALPAQAIENALADAGTSAVDTGRCLI